jgi:hypothetical protein
VTSRTTERFRRAFRDLPVETQRQARRAYRLFLRDPSHPSLRFKRVHTTKPVYSVRVSLGYRALGVQVEEDMLWFWIGSHADYDAILARL